MHFKNQAIQWFPGPYIKLWFQTKQCFRGTVLSFRIFLRTEREVLKAEDLLSIQGREQTTNFINDGNTGAVTRSVNLDEMKGSLTAKADNPN